MSLAKAVAKKQKSMGIVSKIALAAVVGVSIPTIYKLLKSGRGRPNARTVNRYAKFLRMSATKVAALAGRAESASSPSRGKGPRSASSRPMKRGRAAKA